VPDRPVSSSPPSEKVHVACTPNDMASDDKLDKHPISGIKDVVSIALRALGQCLGIRKPPQDETELLELELEPIEFSSGRNSPAPDSPTLGEERPVAYSGIL